VSSEVGRARQEELACLRLEDVRSIGQLARLAIDALVDILVHRLRQVDVLPGPRVRLSEDAVLADREEQLLAIDVDQDPFVHDIHVKRFTRDVRRHPR
jgi:hypothetical protein